MMRLFALLATLSLATASSVQVTPAAFPRAPNATVECEACEFAFKEIIAAVPKNLTLAELKADMDKACAVVPSNMSKACNLIVLGLAPKLFASITGKTSPEASCEELKVCKSSELLTDDTKLCTECESALAALIKGIPPLNKTEEAAITAEAQKLICKNNTLTCKGAVSLGLVSVYKDLANAQANPTDAAKGVCTNAKICPGSALTSCSVCEKALGAAGKAATGFSGDKIKADWEEGCKAFPAASADYKACVADIEAYFPKLVSFLDHLSDSGEATAACTTIGLCPSWDPSWLEKEACTACTEGFTTFTEIVKDSKVTEAEVEADLTKVCSELAKISPKIQAQCAAFLKKDLPTIWAAVDGTTSPAATCASLKACGATPPGPTPPGPAPSPSPAPPTPPGPAPSPPGPAPPACVARGMCLPEHGHRSDCCNGDKGAKHDKHCKGKWKCG